MITVTEEQLRELVRLRWRKQGLDVYPRADIVAAIARNWAGVVAPAGIADNSQRVSHFLSQCAHESDHFRTLEEYASGTAYEGRIDLGNTQPGDGPRFKGKGILQITGRENMRRAGEAIGVDLVANPKLAADPDISLKTAAWYWTDRRINRLADGDHPADVEAVTKAINGGLNGYDDRLAYYRAARMIWRDEAEPPQPEAPEIPPDVGIRELVDELLAKTGAEEVGLFFRRKSS